MAIFGRKTPQCSSDAPSIFQRLTLIISIIHQVSFSEKKSLTLVVAIIFHEDKRVNHKIGKSTCCTSTLLASFASLTTKASKCNNSN